MPEGKRSGSICKLPLASRSRADQPAASGLQCGLRLQTRDSQKRTVVQQQGRIVQILHASGDESVGYLVELLLETQIKEATIIIGAARGGRQFANQAPALLYWRPSHHQVDQPRMGYSPAPPLS